MSNLKNQMIERWTFEFRVHTSTNIFRIICTPGLDYSLKQSSLFADLTHI